LLLALEHIQLHFGGRPILKDINTVINPGERIGLVGPNGAGKSTLLKIIAGELEADGGAIHKASETTVGYLPQDGVDPDPTLTVYQEVEQAFTSILKLQDKVEKTRKKLSELDHESDAHEKALHRYGHLQHQLEASGAYSMQSNIEKTLMGLGFEEEDFNRPTTEFSGGWLMRIALAKLLLRRPSVLLLDEPTNHLDITSLQWIQNFLKKYKGAVLIVSHDRAFLDEVTNRTLSLYNGNIEDYAGNYSYYEKEWEKRQEQLRRAYENQQKKIKEMQDFIDRFRYKADKASLVQSRIKQLEKMDRIELQDDQDEISFEFPHPQRSGAVVMELENIRKQYDDHVIFNDLTYRINRGERIAIVGPNGAGKSTLLRILAGKESINSGDRKPGYNVTTSYFAQHQADELDTSKEVLELLKDEAGYAKETYLRTILGCFLFQGDDVFKKVSVLSGGEKSRLAMARMLVQPANFLLMDEPTNHLDMQSKNILRQALEQYPGTYLIVSHDRAFLDPIVDKVIEVQPGEVRTFLGNVSYYLQRKKEEEEAVDQEVDLDQATKSGVGQKLSRKDERRLEAEKRQQKYRRLKPYKSKIKPIEDKIEKLEKRKDEIEALMQDPGFYDNSSEVEKISVEYDQIKAELDQCYVKWEEIAEKMSDIEESFA